MADSSKAATKGLQVFLVDDSDTNLLVAEARLRILGHEIAVAKDGQQAVKRMQDDAFDVVLMDIQMPLLDGYDATREIRKSEHGATVPIIGISAGGPGVGKTKAIESGMDAFLPKPVDWEQLNRLMHDLCSPENDQNGQLD